MILSFGLQIDYFNSELIKWEPLLEKAQMLIEYKSFLDEAGIKG